MEKERSIIVRKVNVNSDCENTGRIIWDSLVVQVQVSKRK